MLAGVGLAAIPQALLVAQLVAHDGAMLAKPRTITLSVLADRRAAFDHPGATERMNCYDSPDWAATVSVDFFAEFLGARNEVFDERHGFLQIGPAASAGMFARLQASEEQGIVH